MASLAKSIKTRLCMISDTHATTPKPDQCSNYAYRWPLPKADVLLHAGDLTMTGRVSEYEKTLNVLNQADAEIKIVIAGNHDITLDESFYNGAGRMLFHQSRSEDLNQVKEMWTGWKAKQAGIVYLEEGVKTFKLKNGARFTIYTSPWQPAFETWAFNYCRSTDRFNPSVDVASATAVNPVPSWPEIDLMLTHGPPYGVLDAVAANENVGCEHLLKAVQRCRPRVHCFGHIHEGWGAERMNWSEETTKRVEVDSQKTLYQRFAYLDLTNSGGFPLNFGQETVFVNAAILNKRYSPVNAPWVVDLDLPLSVPLGGTDVAMLNDGKS